MLVDFTQLPIERLIFFSPDFSEVEVSMSLLIVIDEVAVGGEVLEAHLALEHLHLALRLAQHALIGV